MSVSERIPVTFLAPSEGSEGSEGKPFTAVLLEEGSQQVSAEPLVERVQAIHLQEDTAGLGAAGALPAAPALQNIHEPVGVVGGHGQGQAAQGQAQGQTGPNARLVPSSTLAAQVPDALAAWDAVRTKNHDARTLRADKLQAFESDVYNTKGIIYLSSRKGGLVVSGESGTGFLIGRLLDGRWSAPVPLRVASVGVGLTVGAASVQTLVLLENWEDLDTFKNTTVREFSFGGGLSLVAGAAGAALHTAPDPGTRNPRETHNRAFHIEKGALMELDLSGSRLTVDQARIRESYGTDFTPAELLSSPAPSEFDPFTGAIDGFVQGISQGQTQGQQKVGGTFARAKERAVETIQRFMPGGEVARGPGGAHP